MSLKFPGKSQFLPNFGCTVVTSVPSFSEIPPSFCILYLWSTYFELFAGSHPVLSNYLNSVHEFTEKSQTTWNIFCPMIWRNYKPKLFLNYYDFSLSSTLSWKKHSADSAKITSFGDKPCQMIYCPIIYRKKAKLTQSKKATFWGQSWPKVERKKPSFGTDLDPLAF